MADNLQDNEWNKFSKIDGLPAVDAIIVEGANEEFEGNQRLETLEANKFEQVDGKPVVRINIVRGGDAGGHIIEDKDDVEFPQRAILQFTDAAVVSDDEANDTTIVSIPTIDPQGLTEITFAASDWQTNLNNQLLLNLLHNLDDENINVAWYENGVDGELEIPWESVSVNEIQGCIPNGKSFNGLVRISGRISGSTGDNVQVFSFGINDWVQFGTTDFFIQSFVHNFGTTNISWDIYDTSGSRIIMCPNTVNNPNSLPFAIFEDERFAGKIYIRRG